MANVLARHDDGTPNFKCKVLTTNSGTGVTRASLRTEWNDLFSRADSDVLFYFSGHGIHTLVSAASMYAYAEAALGAWEQRPLYKSHAARLDPVRLCTPVVPDSLLRELSKFFAAGDAAYPLDKTYEESSPEALQEHVTVFRKFKQLQVAGLLKPEAGTDWYWTAIRSENSVLTSLGQFYRSLAAQGRI